MRIINKIAEVPKVKNEVEGSRATNTLSLRGGQHGRRGNPSCLAQRKRAVRFAYWFTVDRHARKGLAMTTHTFSLRGGSASERRGNPSCLAQRLRLVSLLPGSQWIATGFALAMTRVSKTIRTHQSALRSSQFGLSFSIS
jgi:hypothetical protein